MVDLYLVAQNESCTVCLSSRIQECCCLVAEEWVTTVGQELKDEHCISVWFIYLQFSIQNPKPRNLVLQATKNHYFGFI